MKAATAIILAAERASQMNSAKPTALHEVAGRPIIDWMLAAFEGCVETPPVIVDGSQQMIAAHVGERARTAVQQEALGEADALHAARISEPLPERPGLIKPDTLGILSASGQNAVFVNCAGVRGHATMLLSKN